MSPTRGKRSNRREKESAGAQDEKETEKRGRASTTITKLTEHCKPSSWLRRLIYGVEPAVREHHKPTHAMSTSAVSSVETLSFYCHTCSARFSLHAPSSPFYPPLCPSCRGAYLDDSPTPPQPVLPSPPHPRAVTWPSATSSTPSLPPPIASSSSSPSSTALTSRSSLVHNRGDHDLLPPPLPPWLLQPSASHDTWSHSLSPSDCQPRSPPPAAPRVTLSPSSSSTSTQPLTLGSSTRPPPPWSNDAWEYFFAASDLVVATGKEGPPLNMSLRQACRQFRVLCPQEEQRRRSSPALSPILSACSSAFSSACSSPLLASPPLHRQHQGELQLEPFPPALSPSTTVETMPTSPPPPPWDSPLHGAWDDDYNFSLSGSDYESPPRPPPLPPWPPISAYEATFESSLQRQGLPPISANEDTFETSLQSHGWPATPSPVSANDATFHTPLQCGGSQPAPAESIAALPTVIVNDTELVCPICTDPLLASAPARRLPCGHLYHSDCIVTWLSLRNSCPVCRGSIPLFDFTDADIVSSSSPSFHPTPSSRRRSLQGTSRIRRICSRLLRLMEISRGRRTDSIGNVHV
ncbi:hypothetical protein QYE76_005517 [Lolium multiflorum]|uniref:RING-type domain-containing protein n=1 Tax=Lolium multiflorum TaxID=4521 RepID=A0AAD8W188_LOLMU|nr:hypothetical protein QYE76_005517 [Lolium multiflorum]